MYVFVVGYEAVARRFECIERIGLQPNLGLKTLLGLSIIATITRILVDDTRSQFQS